MISPIGQSRFNSQPPEGGWAIGFMIGRAV